MNSTPKDLAKKRRLTNPTSLHRRSRIFCKTKTQKFWNFKSWGSNPPPVLFLFIIIFLIIFLSIHVSFYRKSNSRFHEVGSPDFTWWHRKAKKEQPAKRNGYSNRES